MANALQRAANEARRGTLTEARTRDLLSEILASVNGEGLRTFTVAEWFDYFVGQKRKSKAEGTAVKHEQIVREFIAFLGHRSRLNIAAITSRDIAEFRDHRQSRGLAPATLKLDVSILSSAFNSALKQGHVSVNPCAAIEPVRDQAERKSTFSPEQIASLVRNADGEWRGLILLAFYTGARLGDCLNLRWKNVDLVSEIKTLRFRQGKTGREIVTVLHPELEDYLLSLPAPGSDDAFLFPSLTHRNNLSLAFSGIMDRARIDNRVIREPGASGHTVHALSFHSLRHSFASLLANAGIAEETRMALTGHATRDQQQRYTHRELGILRDAVNVLPDVLG